METNLSVWLLLSSGIIYVAKASSNFIPLSLGPDFQSPYSEEDILRGFKVNIAEGESPLKQHVFKGEINPIPFSTTYARSEVITSTEEVKNMLEIEGSLSVSYGPLISGEGSGRYLEDKVNSKRQATILYRTRRVAYARSVDVKTLEPNKNNLYSLSGDEIADIYGTKFINQMIYGAQLDVIFTVTSTTDIDLTEIEAQLKGRIGVGPLSVGFEAKFSKQEGSSSSDMTMSIVAQASGVNFNTPPNPSFNQTNELIEQFNARYDELLSSTADLDTVDDEGNVLNQLSPVGFTLASVADYLPKLDEFEIAALDNKMSELRDVFYSALFWKSQLLAAKNIQEALYPDPRDREEIFEPYAGEMNRVIEKLDAKVEECLLFRRQPLATIIGRSGTFVPVPEMYPKSEQESNVVKGLKGDLYIPSPVVIGDSKFEQVHYIGFALPIESNNDRLEPWMTGMVRRDRDNGIVTRANTVAELERITSFAVNNAIPEEMAWGEVVTIRNFQSGNMLAADSIGNLKADGSITSDRWLFVRSDCEGDYAYAGPCYEIRNVDSLDRRMHAQTGENDQEGFGVGATTAASKWVLKEADECQGRKDCFFIVNTSSGRRILEHSDDFDTNFVSSSQDAKCEYDGTHRLFRTESNSPVASLENCYELCVETPDCHYFSFGDSPANPDFKGVCIGCTKDSSFGAYNGFNTYELGSGERGVGAGTWADEKFNHEKWIIQISDESEIGRADPVPENVEWGDMVEIKNLGSSRRLYLSSRGELEAKSDTGSPDHKWMFARTTCDDIGVGPVPTPTPVDSQTSPSCSPFEGGHLTCNGGASVNVDFQRKGICASSSSSWRHCDNDENRNSCLAECSKKDSNGCCSYRAHLASGNNGIDSNTGKYGCLYHPGDGQELVYDGNTDIFGSICISADDTTTDAYAISEGILGTSGAGGTCTCPSGITYVVADNYDGCQSLQCVGGVSEFKCNDPVTGADNGYQYAGAMGKRGWGVVCGTSTDNVVPTSPPSKPPSPASSSTCYEIIHADTGFRMLNQKWKLIESQCDDDTAPCFLLENMSSGLYLIDDGTNNGIVETPYFSDSQSYNNQWVLERFAIETPTPSPTDSPTAAPTTEIRVTAPIDGDESGGMMGVFVTLSIVAFVGCGLAFFLYRRSRNKKVPDSKTIPTGVVFSNEDPLGFMESGNAKTGGSVVTEEASIVVTKEAE